MKKTIHFETLGCRLNQDETEGAARCFSNAGFNVDLDSVSASTEYSDEVVLCVINTCTVTCKAEQKARRIIRLLLEKFPKAPVIVTGCYAELDGAQITLMDEKRIVILPGQKKYLLSKRADKVPQNFHKVLPHRNQYLKVQCNYILPNIQKSPLLFE